MKKLFVPVIATLALTALPAVAQTPPPEPTPPCSTSEQFTTVGIAGKQQAFAPRQTPSVGHDLTETPYNEDSVSRFRYRIDVSGSTTKPFAKKATVDLTLSWDNDSDFDLYVYDKNDTLIDSSVSFNPLDGAGESVSLTAVEHCTDIRIDVVNYLGLPNSALVLDAKLTGLK